MLAGRNPNKLQALAESLGDAVISYHLADFTLCDGPALIDEITASLGGLDLALIAHGDLGSQEESEHHFDAALATFESNLLSAVALLIPLANYLQTQGHGHLAVLSSVAGLRGRPRNYTYGAAKSALTTYMQGLCSRLWPHVSTHTFLLGPVDSPMTANHPKNALFATPATVAKAIEAAIERDVAEAYVPWYWRPIMETVERLPEPIFQQFKFLSGR